ncbi:MAG: MFS transporter [Gemmatimonadales bacterium]
MTKLIVLFVVAFVDTVGASLVVPILPFYATRYGANALLVGLLISAFSVTQLISAPSWGRLSDRYGRRPSILFGLIISALAYVVFAFAGSWQMLLLSRLVQGVGGGTIGVVTAYVADASPPEKRTKSIGWLTTVTSLGWLSGAALGSFLVAIGGPKAPGLFTAGFSLIVAAFAYRFLAESKGMRPSGTHAVAAKVRTGREAILHVITRWQEPAPRLIWIYALGIAAFYGNAAVMPLLLQERLGITEKTIGYIVMYFSGMGVIVRAGILGRMVDWLGEPRLARVGIGFLAVGLATMALGHSFPVLVTSFTLMPLGMAFLFPSVSGLLSQLVPSAERGLYLGVQQTFGGVARVAYPILAGALMDGFNKGTPFLVGAVLMLATLPLTAGLQPVKHAPAT